MGEPCDTHIRHTEQREQEGAKGCGEGEQLPVSLEDLKVVCQACDDGLHAAHLMDKTHTQMNCCMTQIGTYRDAEKILGQFLLGRGLSLINKRETKCNEIFFSLFFFHI